ncbi:MAG: glutamate-cysteine ligase family protein [Candidatus Micrarchaeota archaeon]
MRKKSTYGLEVEFLLIDEAGQITNSADSLLERIRGKRIDYHVRPEVSKFMIEVGAHPKPTVRQSAKGFLKTLSILSDEAKKIDLRLLPLAAYPGAVKPVMRKKPWYKMQEMVLGKEALENAGCVTGFHFHASLPKGIYDSAKDDLRPQKRGKAEKLLVDQYNFLIAIDPAAITLMQSSPFYQGTYLCKDSRVAVYRNMEIKECRTRGIYYSNPLFGELPQYEHTSADISYLIKLRKRRWLDLLEHKNMKLTASIRKAHPLRFYWGPLRINKVGTFELRGMDMNLPSIMLGTSTLIKRGLLGIETDNLDVVPSELGAQMPFKVEGGKLHIPPYREVENLIRKSAVHGLASPQVKNYVTRLHKFAVKYLDIKADLAVNRIRGMLESGKTTSDRIIELSGMGIPTVGYKLNQKKAAEIALEFANRFEDDIAELMHSYVILDAP